MTDALNIIALAQAPARDRTERYVARLDQHLETLPKDARGAFLESQAANWRTNYLEWARRVDAGEASEKELTYTAWDFTLTLAEIGKRQARYQAPVTP